jgi:hypothetical protein
MHDKISHASITQFLAATVPLGERRQLLRAVFLDRVWLGLLVIALTAVPMSVSRIFFTGWRTVYAIHLFFLVAVVAGWLLRHRLSFLSRVVIVIAFMNLAAIAGVTTFGLLGSAWWWMFNAALLLSMLYSIRAGLIHAAVAVVVLCGTGLAFINGWLTLNFDANVYMGQYPAWLTLLLGPVQLTVFIFWAISAYQEATLGLLREVDKRREQRETLILQLKQALDEIQTLRGFIPICAHCKKIRHDEGFWENVEAFIRRHTHAELTHALCPSCGVELYGELWHDAMKERSEPPQW